MDACLKKAVRPVHRIDGNSTLHLSLVFTPRASPIYYSVTCSLSASTLTFALPYRGPIRRDRSQDVHRVVPEGLAIVKEEWGADVLVRTSTFP